MSDYAITAANVVHDANAQFDEQIAGVAITAGQVTYIDPATGTAKLANAVTSATTAAASGIALHAAAAGQPIRRQISGDINLGTTLTVGVPVVVSGANSGGAAPVGDVASGWYTMILGMPKSASILTLCFAQPSTLVAHA